LRFIEDYENDLKKLIYGKRANSFNISNYMLRGRTGNADIKIGKLISKSSSCSDFVYNVKNELIKETNTDYLHFSLIMGLYFGYFNLYNYLYIKPSVRKKIVESEPSRRKTMNFIVKHYSYLLKYFHNKYGIEDDLLKNIISKMLFMIDNDNDHEVLYNNYVTKDIGLILMGISLSGEFTSCEDAINVFYKENDDCKLKIN